MSSEPLLDRAGAYFRELQDRIVAALERADGSRFREDLWQRPGAAAAAPGCWRTASCSRRPG
jgi:coproporphyrinogen III oxidase